MGEYLSVNGVAVLNVLPCEACPPWLEKYRNFCSDECCMEDLTFIYGEPRWKGTPAL